MAENKPGFSEEKRSDNDNRKSSTKAAPSQAKPTATEMSLKERWNSIQLSKTAILWICLAMIAGTVLVGFAWGGWETSSAAQRTATTAANDAVAQRLATICVAQSQQDPAQAQKLEELKSGTSYAQTSFVNDQGWATMPGEEQAENKVAAECAKLLAQQE